MRVHSHSNRVSRRCSGARAERLRASPSTADIALGFSRGRSSLLVSTALATGVLTCVLTGAFLGAGPANAAGECGVASPAAGTVTCTSTGNPYTNGIAYAPSGDLTLVLDPTVVVNNPNNSVIAVSHAFGVSVPPLAPPDVAPLGNAAPNFNVTITVSGSAGGGAHITTSGYKSPGIYGAVDATTLTIKNTGTIVTSGASSNGIIGRAYSGAVNITNYSGGSVTTGNNSAGNTFSTGISGYATSGSVTITNNGSVANTGGTSAGLNGVVSSGSGALAITNNGTIVSGSAGSAYSDGIVANSGSTGIITITNSGTGSITTTGDHGSDGINVPSFSTNSSVVISNAGRIVTQGLDTGNNNGNYGINVVSAVTASVTNTSTGTISTAGPISAGIGVFATTITIVNSGGVTTQGQSSNGIQAYASSGTALVKNYGNITTHGYGSRGIVATSSSNSVTIANYASGTIIVTGDNARGMTGVAYAGNALTMINAGTIKTYGNSTFGIRANNSGGTGPITISSTGTVKTYGSGATGIVVPSVASNVAVTANNVQAFGANASAISVTTTGTAAFTTTGTISGTLSGITATAAGGTSLINTGSIGAANDAALVISGGAATINNSGLITGHITLTANDDIVNNNGGGVFAARGDSDFGAGSNTFNNSGTFSLASPGSVTLSNLQTFNNSGGLVSMTNGTPTDRLTLPGNFSGTGSSGLAVDAFLAGPGNSKADLLTVGGNVTGSTAVTVINTGGPGAINKTGIPIVNVAGTTGTGNFFLANGPIIAGDDAYSLILLPGGVWALESSQIVLSQVLPPGSGANAANVAAAIDAFLANGGTPPAGFLNLFKLSPQQLANALSQLSGEPATGTQTSSFELMNEFLSLLTGPSGSAGNGGGPALPFAPERADAFPSDVALAYASVLKAPPRPVPHWTAWGAAFGGSNTTRGDLAGAGSHDATARAGAFAAGIDYHASPDTIIGFALAGGGTSWGLSAGLGGGHSDSVMAGLYGSRQSGQAYLSGALTYASYWMSTNRTVTLAGADSLNASFNAQDFGGRLEGGYRFAAWAPVSVIPYAAVQAQSFHTPGYSESGSLGVPDPFALSYAAQTATAVRAELGSRFDQVFAQADGGSVDLFSRAAWAHDWQSNPNLTATFIGLPAASFVVNGATPPRDLALATAGAEWHRRDGWSVMGKLDGEFGNRSETYIGTVRVRYTW